MVVALSEESQATKYDDKDIMGDKPNCHVGISRIMNI